MLLNKGRAIGTCCIYAAILFGCRTETSEKGQLSEIVTEAAGTDADAIVHRQTLQGLDLVVYRQCLGITTTNEIRKINEGCTKFTAKAPESAVLYTEFITAIAENLGVAVAQYRQKTIDQ